MLLLLIMPIEIHQVTLKCYMPIWQAALRNAGILRRYTHSTLCILIMRIGMQQVK
jgi:hypothetical protein